MRAARGPPGVRSLPPRDPRRSQQVTFRMSSVQGHATTPRAVTYGPPHWDGDRRVWTVTRYRDVSLLLRHPDLPVADLCAGIERIERRVGGGFPFLRNLLGGLTIFHNPPRHRESRGQVKSLVAAVAQAAVASTVDAIAAELLDDLPLTGSSNAVASLCYPLPERVLALGLDLDPRDVAVIRRAGDRLCRAWAPGLPIRAYRELECDAANVAAFIGERLSSSRRFKDDADLETGPDVHGWVPYVFFLVGAGVANTAGMLAAILLGLSESAHWAKQLRNAPELIGAFIDESIRLRGPVRVLTRRQVAADIRVDDIELPRGAWVEFDLEKAHRDPSAYEDPHAFDPLRKAPPHLGFGLGAHACLGASLAKIEARALVDAVLRRFELAVPASPPRWDIDSEFSLLAELPLIFRPR